MFTKVYPLGEPARRLWPDMWQARNQVVGVALATALGLFFRLHNLAGRPLNSQEIYTWDFSHQSVAFIFSRLSDIETNPPFYYLLVKMVMLFGDSEPLLRLPSIAAGTLAIPLIYLLGRVGGVPKSGVMAAFLVSLNSIAINYSQTARTYALLQDVSLVAAIGAVLVIRSYWDRGKAVAEPARYEMLGWILFSAGCVAGFYLHYTFLFGICALECAIAAGLAQAWLSGAGRIDRTLLWRWMASCLVMLLLTAWGLKLALSLRTSDNIGYIKIPSLLDAIHMLVKVDGYRDLSRFEPVPSLILFAVAVVGLLRGWRRSNAILVCGTLFGLYPMLLFTASQQRPIFEERTLVAPNFAACLLAGYGALSIGRWLLMMVRSNLVRRILGSSPTRIWSRLVPAAPFAAILLVAFVSAANSARGPEIVEPYDQATKFLASVMKPGDVAAGTDGIIYYRRRLNANFPYFKLAEGNTAEAQVTYASPAVGSREVPNLAYDDHSVYLVLRDKIGLKIDGRRYSSYTNYVLNALGHREPPLALFSGLSIYRLPGRKIDADDLGSISARDR